MTNTENQMKQIENEIQALAVELECGIIMEDEFVRKTHDEKMKMRIRAKEINNRWNKLFMKSSNFKISSEQIILTICMNHLLVQAWIASGGLKRRVQMKKIEREEYVVEEEEVVVERFEYKGVVFLKEMGLFPQVLYDPKTHDEVGWKCGGGEIILK